MNKNFGRAILAGLVATAAMTMLMLVGPMMGMPKMPIGDMLASFMGIPVFVGWAVHFMIGAVLGLIYVFVFAERLPGASAARGAIYGLIPWFLAQVMVNPMMGAGFFAISTPAPLMMVMGSLMGHLVYGAVLGGVYGKGRRVTASMPISGIA
jgi:uncharacterized membrane protein YagU involved in acid resistance